MLALVSPTAINMCVCIYVNSAVSVHDHSIVLRLQSIPRRRMVASH